MTTPTDDLSARHVAVLHAFRDDYATYIPQFHAQNRKRMKLLLADLDAAIAARSAAVPVEALEGLVKLKEAYCRCDGTQEAEDAAILAILNKIDELTQLIKERSNG